MLDLDSRMQSSTHLISSSYMKTMVQGFETSISGAGIFPSTKKKAMLLEKKSGEASRLLSFYKR